MQVLIVDDSPVSREHLKHLVTKAGYDALLFDSAEALLSWVDSNSLNDSLILLDWIMPDLQGPDLCRHIREKHSESNPYIIMVSAKDSGEDVALGLGAGADDYISKPFRADEVTARLDVGVRTIRLRNALAESNRRRLVAERFAGVGQLAAGAAHEINNPLGFLKSNIHMLSAGMPQTCALLKRLLDPNEPIDAIRSSVDLPELQETLQDFSDMLEDMSEGVERIGAIVSSLNSFTIEKPIKTDGLDLAELLRTIAGDEVGLEISISSKLCADRFQLVQMLTELLNNARWAVRDGGSIYINADENNGHIKLVVSDTGVGIRPDDLPRVCDPFFTTRPVGEALGMGLTRAEAILRNHGGSMKLESPASGKGTRVICEIPLQ